MIFLVIPAFFGHSRVGGNLFSHLIRYINQSNVSYLAQ